MLGFAEAGQVRVNGGDDWTDVSEVDLDLTEVLTLFEQVCGVGMAQRVNMSCLSDATGFESQAEGALQRGAAHGLGGRGSALTGVTLGGEEQRRMAMRFPLIAQEQKRALGQRHVTIAVALARADVQEHALGIDVAHLKVQAFPQAQAAGINGGQADALIQGGNRGQEASDFGGGEDDRKFELMIGANQFNFSGPGKPEGFFPEEFDGAEGLGAGLAGDFLDALEMDEILTELFRGDQVGGLGVELTQLTDTGEVSLLGARLDTEQLQVIGK